MAEEAFDAEFEEEAPAPEAEEQTPQEDGRQAAAGQEGEQGEGAPEDDGPPEFDERAQRFIDERIVAPKTARIREIEERLQAREQELEQLRSRLPEDAPPAVPDLPDPWDENYEDKIKARDEALLARRDWELEQKSREEQDQQARQRQQQEQAQAFNKIKAGYRERAAKLEVAPKDLALAGAAVGQSGIPVETGQHILEHESGPLLTLYLAENPADLEDLRQMSPLRAAVHLETKILPKAGKRKQKPPPPPADGVKGSGPGKDPALKGMTFE